jgi:branched-chain amino acid transport system substrate-binding protein
MHRPKRLVLLFAAFALVAAACGSSDSDTTTTTTGAPAATTTTAGPAATTTTTQPADTSPIIIGAVFDFNSIMAPFDGPAFAAAQIQVDEINAAGGVLGRQLDLRVLDTDPLDAALSKANALDLIGQGAQVLLVTCDVGLATPAIQEALDAGLLAIAPCIGTDQMGPNGFGAAGARAFSLGNLAQDEGAVLAEFAFEVLGARRGAVVKDNVIIYFQDVVDAFKVRFEELGGEIVLEEGFVTGDGTLGNVVSSVEGEDLDVIAFTSFPDSNAEFAAGLRSLGDETPIVCGWACDGDFWIPEGLSNFYVDTFVSIFGDDPDAGVNSIIAALDAAGNSPGTGGFIVGASAIQAIVAAIESTGGTDGAALAAAFEAFDGVDTVSGPVSYSSDFHTVFGRPFRIIQFQDGVASLVEVRAATSPADIG